MAKQYPTMAQRRLAKILPPDLYKPGDVLSKKKQKEILSRLARERPEDYPKAVEQLNALGIDVAASDGTTTLSTSDMHTPLRAKLRREKIRREIATILDKGGKGDDIVALLASHVDDDRREILEDSEKEGNPLALQLKGAGRGNPSSLAALRGGGLIYTDEAGRPLPVAVTRSFSQGLTPFQYFMGAKADRRNIIDAKLGVGSGGYAAKTLKQAVHRLVVTGQDAEDPESVKDRGLPAEVTDPDNDGALLARATGGFEANTVLTPKIRDALKRQGVKDIVVRSPIASGSPDGGVYARDLGEREYGRLPEVGSFASHSAADAISEKVTQSLLSSKHKAVSALSGIDPHLSGFDLIDRVLNPPKSRRGFAAHAETDGRVGALSKAPQGGHYLMVGGKQHHIPEGYEIKVKPGQMIEAGDQLTDGTVDHVAVTKHKGLGEGRRSLVQAISQSLEKNGFRGHRRNIEVLARGLLDRVQLTAELGDYSPGDVVPYHRLEAEYKPRKEAAERQLGDATGKYLEKPVLHYSVGTKIRPSVAKTLEKFGHRSVLVHPDPPPFEPAVVRGVDLLQTDPDWMTRHLGGNIQKGFLEAAHRGRESDETSTSFVGARARLVDFNRPGMKTTLQPERQNG